MGLGALLLTVAALQSGRTADTTWTAARSARLRTVGALAVSPAGDRVVFEVRSDNVEPGVSRTTTRLWVAGTEGAGARPLPMEDASGPAWMPDGRHVVFVAARQGPPNVWSVDIETGAERQLTASPTGVGAFRLSRDGRQLAFVAPDMPSAETIAAMRETELRVIRDPAVSLNLHVVVVGEGAGREARQLTRGSWVINGFDWSADGIALAFSHQERAGPSGLFTTELSRVDVASGEVRALVRQPGFDVQPFYSPDGRWIAFTTSEGDTSRALHQYHTRLALVPADGGPIRYLARTANELVGYLQWSPDGRAVYGIEPAGTVQAVSRFPIDGGGATELFRPEGAIVAAAFTPDGTVIHANEAMDRPVEVYARSAGRGDVALTALNRDLAGTVYGRSELVRWQSQDGTEIEGLLTYPVGYREGGRYPTLVIGHAGLYHHNQNHSARLTVFHVQAFAAAGFAVLRPNPRGSNNQSRAFRAAITADWSGTAYADVMAGVDQVIAMGVADPDRLAIMGWSTGGYMTAVALSRTNRFAAAIAGAAPVDLVSFTATTDDPDWLPGFFGAFVWDDDREYRRQSPLFRMKDVRTPTLILAGESDARVPVSQAWELYRTLSGMGTDVRMILIPGMGHGPSNPRQLLRLSEEVLRWLQERLSKAGG
jgi:dipeptidyl aminopeptidase/acylaminoacyl peptidase